MLNPTTITQKAFATPVEVGAYDTPDDAFGVTVVGTYAYVANYVGGLCVAWKRFVVATFADNAATTNQLPSA